MAEKLDTPFSLSSSLQSIAQFRIPARSELPNRTVRSVLLTPAERLFAGADASHLIFVFISFFFDRPPSVVPPFAARFTKLEAFPELISESFSACRGHDSESFGVT